MEDSIDLYPQIYNLSNLFIAWRKARKGKSKIDYVIEFEKGLIKNLLELFHELKSQRYKPKPLETFILQDPKTRKISKSDFRDRIVHHALHNILESIFDKAFIYDSCANRKGKGNLFAIKRFDKFMKIVSKNKTRNCFVLKADIKHYFQEVNHEILLDALKRRIKDEKITWLIAQILKNFEDKEKGMPLGNLTSQFFANIYLHELDFFIKHRLKSKHYIRYVDDFVILHESKEQLEIWKEQIDGFLREKLRLELHSEKSKIIPLSQGVDFVGFRNFYYFKLLRKRNVKNMENKIGLFHMKKMSLNKILESFQGWNAYAMWANTCELRKRLFKNLFSIA